jgi:hypothetical protein
MVRPTLRCLREDPGLPVHTAQITLDQVEHPLLVKAGERFAQTNAPHERVGAAVPELDDLCCLVVIEAA